jgi:DNA-binding transcriptional MocR family regulator
VVHLSTNTNSPNTNGETEVMRFLHSWLPSIFRRSATYSIRRNFLSSTTQGVPRWLSLTPFPTRIMTTQAAKNGTTGRPINLLRGWPAPELLPVELLKATSVAVLTDPSIFVSALQYGPDPGYQPLREELAQWLGGHFNVTPDQKRICITGGASQNIANILQSFTDPVYTKAVWMVAPCYFLACPIFADSGFGGRLKAVPEDDEGIDLVFLEKGLESIASEDPGDGVSVTTELSSRQSDMAIR